MEDLYRVLQVDPGADPALVNDAWRRLARVYHPDGQHPNVERFQAVAAAYRVLGDPARRAEYDRRREDGAGVEDDPTGNAERGVGSTHGGDPHDVGTACWRHPSLPAIVACTGCGAPLCAGCAAHWRPPYCDLCVRGEGLRRQWQIAWPLTALLLWALFSVGALAAALELDLRLAQTVEFLLFAHLLGPGLVGTADLEWMVLRNVVRSAALRALIASALAIVLICFCPLLLVAGTVTAVIRTVLALRAYPAGRRLREQAEGNLAQ